MSMAKKLSAIAELNLKRVEIEHIKEAMRKGQEEINNQENRLRQIQADARAQQDKLASLQAQQAQYDDISAKVVQQQNILQALARENDKMDNDIKLRRHQHSIEIEALDKALNDKLEQTRRKTKDAETGMIEMINRLQQEIDALQAQRESLEQWTEDKLQEVATEVKALHDREQYISTELINIDKERKALKDMRRLIQHINDKNSI